MCDVTTNYELPTRQQAKQDWNGSTALKGFSDCAQSSKKSKDITGKDTLLFPHKFVII